MATFFNFRGACTYNHETSKTIRDKLKLTKLTIKVWVQ